MAFQSVWYYSDLPEDIVDIFNGYPIEALYRGVCFRLPKFSLCPERVAYFPEFPAIIADIKYFVRMATQSVTARRLGQNKLSECGTSLRNTQLMCLLISFPISFIGYYCSDYIIPLFLMDPDVIPLGMEYFSIVLRQIWSSFFH